MKTIMTKDGRMEDNIRESRRSPTNAEIRQRIYEIVVVRGNAIGRDLGEWLRVKREIERERAAANGSKMNEPRGYGPGAANRAVRTGASHA